MIAGALTLKRPDLKKKVRDISSDFFQRFTVLQIIMAPEVISVIGELPILSELVHALYDCHYNKLFIALGQQQSTFMSEKISDVQTSKIGGYIPVPLTDPQRPRSVLCAGNAHIGIRATSRSYRSLTLESMSTAFGVSIDFIDRCVIFLGNKYSEANETLQRAVPLHLARSFELHYRQGARHR